MQAIVPTDHELVMAYKAGDENGLSKLVHRHQRKVFGYIKSVVKDHQVAEDIFQDAFIKVVNTIKSGNYNEEGKFIQWVMRIAHNLTMDHFRNNKKMPMSRSTDEFDVFKTIPMVEGSAEDQLVKRQILSQIRDLVEHLPEDQREIVRLRIYEELSFKEIADQHNMSINTALGRMRYALINLRKLIEKHQIVLSY